MWFLLKRIFCFVLVILILSFPIQWIIDYGIKKSSLSINYTEWNNLFESKINCDFLIMGSSRAWLHISPRIIDSTFSINSYNIGLDGYDFFMQFYQFNAYLLYNKPPKYLLVSLDGIGFLKREDLYNYEQFLPYMNKPYIKEAIYHFEGFDWRDKFIPFYKFTHTKGIVFRGLKWGCTKEIYKNGKYKGFCGRDIHWKKNYFKELERGIIKNDNTNKVKTKLVYSDNLFFEFIKICRNKKIKLIFVYCPEFRFKERNIVNRDKIIRYYQKISNYYSIPFFNYSSIPMCFDSSNFYTVQHLNKKGVDSFNYLLCNDLKKVVH
jgi:hypothetical protein